MLEQAPELEMTMDVAHFVALGAAPAEIDLLLARSRHVHVRGAAPGSLQAPMKTSSVDYERLIDTLDGQAYGGAITLEYAWDHWEGLDQVDVVSEIVMLRLRLLGHAAGRVWSYPRFGWPIEAQ
jgi:hypothetical protein